MKRYEISLDADSGYRDWTIWNGVRELISNAVDADRDGSQMSIEHLFRIRKGSQIPTLVISNVGATIPKEAFLIGHTTKHSSDQIGRYGEGFKFGLLTLLRYGFEIKIRNGEESWIPRIVRSSEYDANVLAFDVAAGNKADQRVQIEILGLDLESWSDYKNKCLFLKERQSQDYIKIPSGEILLSPQEKGNIYCKGIFVRREMSCNYGYNFYSASLDRDRKIVDDLNYLIATCLYEASSLGFLKDELYFLLKEESNDTRSLFSLPADATEGLVNSFKKEHGQNALVVDTAEQGLKLSHFGIKGIKVPYNLKSILIPVLGNAAQHLQNLKFATKNQFELENLSTTEQVIYNEVNFMLSSVLPRAKISSSILEIIKIVEFNDPNLAGVYSSDDKSIMIARKCLTSIPKFLRVLIHEIAHDLGGADGDKSHEEAIGNLTEEIFSFFLSLKESN